MAYGEATVRADSVYEAAHGHLRVDVRVEVLYRMEWEHVHLQGEGKEVGEEITFFSHHATCSIM